MQTSLGRIGFVGGGKMAAALVTAILRSKLARPEDVLCSDTAPQQRETLTEKYGIRVTGANEDVLVGSDIVFLAVKPQVFANAVAGLRARADQLVVSIMAGVQIARIRDLLGGKVVRVMPNTACLVGAMAAGYAVAAEVTAGDKARVQQLLASAGVAVEVSEADLDAVTGLSGSGPAFVARLIEAFAEAGAAAGLDAEIAQKLAVQTFAGTARLLAEANLTPAALVEMVSSPNGTTVAGRAVLENSDVAEVLRRTILRAAERSRELGRD